MPSDPSRRVSVSTGRRAGQLMLHGMTTIRDRVHFRLTQSLHRKFSREQIGLYPHHRVADAAGRMESMQAVHQCNFRAAIGLCVVLGAIRAAFAIKPFTLVEDGYPERVGQLES